MPKIPASERDAFYEARRSELAAVALKLWAENGFDQTSVARIAQEAGVAKGTFYLYFESKQALLVDVLRRNSLIPHMLELGADLQHKTLDEAVRGFVSGVWRHLVDHRDLVLVLFREFPTHLEEAQHFIEHVMVPSNRAVAGFLESHIDPARAEKLSSIVAVRGLIGMILVVFVTQELLGANRFLPIGEDEITTTLAELFLHGVCDGADARPSAEEGIASLNAPANREVIEE